LLQITVWLIDFLHFILCQLENRSG